MHLSDQLKGPVSRLGPGKNGFAKFYIRENSRKTCVGVAVDFADKTKTTGTPTANFEGFEFMLQALQHYRSRSSSPSQRSPTLSDQVLNTVLIQKNVLKTQ